MYKRQVVVHQKAVQILRAAVRTAIAIPVAALHIQEVLQAAAPVSYTHLDVYKRQLT